MKENRTYVYTGPVMNFDICVDRNWQGETWAPTEKRALSNLAFRYKREHNLTNNARITLPGKITMKGEQ